MNLTKLKRYLVGFLTLALLFAMVPTPAAFAASNIFIIVRDQDGNPVNDATVTVTKGNTNCPVTKEIEAGKYGFEGGKNTNYNIRVDAEGYDSLETSKRMKSGDSLTLTLTKKATEPPTVPTEPANPQAEWHTFDAFYYIGGGGHTFPTDGYAASGDPTHYGPSGNDTPFAHIRVDIAALKTHTDAVLFVEEGDGNLWHFEPLKDDDIDSAKAFWAAVLECTDAESIAVLKATTLYDDFVGYCLKNQSSAGDYHMDGIIAQDPPVYVVELHEDGVYFAGQVNGAEGPFPTRQDVLKLMDRHWPYVITWNEDENGYPIPNENGDHTGTYVVPQETGFMIYDVEVQKLNAANATLSVPGTDILYEEVGDYYFLAQFEIHTKLRGHEEMHTVIYTDGTGNASAFTNHQYGFQCNNLVPVFPHAPHREGYEFVGWRKEGGDDTLYSQEDIAVMVADENLIFHAVWAYSVQFHANNEAANGGEDVFRTYTPAGEDGTYSLNADGTVPLFYDIPEFDYETHNGYIFKGWYTADGTPMDWSAAPNGNTHYYAHWFTVGQVAQEEDGKVLPAGWNGVYPGYDMTGVQIRTAENDPKDHNGTAGGGLRFIAVLSEALYSQINSLPGNEGGAEYGFVMAKRSLVDAKATGADYRLEYKATNVNGKDTTADYSYVTNLCCSGFVDHFSGQGYRLYTGVVTYKNAAAQGDAVLATAHASDMTVRAYIRYYDANGLLRTYYNNYTGNSRIGGGCSASYNTALALVKGE